jgi:hypothetical protein
VIATEDDEILGAELIVNRMMSAVGNVQLLVDYDDGTLRDSGEFKRTGYALGYQRRFGMEFIGSIMGTYREGTGTSAYDVKLISVGLRKTW